ncbi:PEP-CTERM sorting domain-containing protein [Haloferula sp. BvORR071]|uniref:PEP-CTERM sorting domain-containing protein n=1 Tax=Haloferula sp. BvORR071 TaxID=1396141 RepID=UPI0005595161|nr:PEP-CTERM sorting domain-containing protein [Haloferula sp. BvORR071]
MKTLLFTTLLACTAPLAQAALTDITIFDGLTGHSYGTDPRGIYEYKEVEVGNLATDPWDLRALGYDKDSNTLAYVGGYNPTMLTDPSHNLFGISTIFIETGPNRAPMGTNDGTNGFETQSNSVFGYDYAITLSVSGTNQLTYSIYQLTPSSVLTSVWFGDNEVAGPYKFTPGSETQFGVTKLATVLSVNDAYLDNAFNPDLNLGEPNWFATFDLTPIASALEANGASFYLTQACGNDLIVGQIGPVPQQLSTIPEPGSMLGLAGLLLGGACFRSRRSSRS